MAYFYTARILYSVGFLYYLGADYVCYSFVLLSGIYGF
ncbi:Uncharacterized protein YR821_1243 [Yersinia ruckeri]|nr:hypothetical protein yruck0001_19580 [Yersinia ruckeri ATCC 29473]QTD76174.1 Uncharacterized protein YR821_1243 [Yersinia ruckeri]